MRVLLTTTSFQDTPGPHHERLAASGHEIVRARGPLTEREMLARVAEDGGYDALLHGDDALTRGVLEAACPRLKVLSKYGIGLDAVDLEAATDLGIPVLYTPGVNHTTVAEHAFALILALCRHLVPEVQAVKAGTWKRVTGRELAEKTLGIVGLGRIGKAVAERAGAFGLRPLVHTAHWDAGLAERHGLRRAESLDDLVTEADIVTLHTHLGSGNRGLFGPERIARMKDGALLINTARGALVDESAVAEACRSGKLGGYGADVLAREPIEPPHPFQELDNAIVTPHIGSRTRESVARQATMAVENLLAALRGEEPAARANDAPVRPPREE